MSQPYFLFSINYTIKRKLIRGYRFLSVK